MSSGTRFPFADALAVAQEIVGQLDPACVRLAIAGSIRRRKADVGDIELVVIPRYREEPSSLWGETTQVSVLGERLAFLEGGVPDNRSAFLERLSGGDRYAKLRHVRSGLQVDLFLVLPPASWGVIYLIRTGPADYSQWLVTYARRRGMHVANGALRHGLVDHSVVGEFGQVRQCSCEVIPTPEERDVYSALALPWVEPVDRRVPWVAP